MNSDVVIFLLVVGARFLLPLTIFRYPLPGVIACLILDAVDQTIFQRNTSWDLDNYQGYDKAMDIYYLTIAYISTMANWVNRAAFRVSRFLYYWRLVGATLFELTQIRAVLIIFPNTFEYFFIWYEAIRARWNPAKISKGFWIISAAAIWIFIKLPQEYIIHIAQVDISEFINTEIFGVPAHYTFIEACLAEPGIALALAATAIAIILVARHFFRAYAPKPDWKLRLKADPIAVRAPEKQALFSRHLFEKVIMTGLITVIFAHVVPAGELSDAQLFLAAAFLALVNGPVGYWMAVRFHLMRSFMKQFVLMSLVNVLFAYLYIAFLPDFSESVAFHSIFFFSALLTFLGITFDRYAVVQRSA